jgi:hypothetical protein
VAAGAGASLIPPGETSSSIEYTKERVTNESLFFLGVSKRIKRGYLDAQNSTAVPTIILYNAKGANPRRLTQAINHATVP